jgi:hypothetical protein
MRVGNSKNISNLVAALMSRKSGVLARVQAFVTTSRDQNPGSKNRAGPDQDKVAPNANIHSLAPTPDKVTFNDHCFVCQTDHPAVVVLFGNVRLALSSATGCREIQVSGKPRLVLGQRMRSGLSQEIGGSTSVGM